MFARRRAAANLERRLRARVHSTLWALVQLLGRAAARRLATRRWAAARIEFRATRRRSFRVVGF